MKVEIFLSIILFVVIHEFVHQSNADCPPQDSMKKFNASLFAGRWYEVKRYKTVFSALSGQCVAWNFTVNSANNVTIALSTFITDRIITARNFAAMKANGTMDWKFTFGAITFEFQYYIADTDYTNWAVSFACINIPLIANFQMAWVYGRTRSLPQPFVDAANVAIKARKLNPNNFIDVNQQGCKN